MPTSKWTKPSRKNDERDSRDNHRKPMDKPWAKKAPTDKPRKAQLSKGWDQAADWYSEHARAPGTLIDTVVRPNILRLLDKEPKKRIVDVACGEGALARELHKRAWTVTGVDLSGELITKAREASSTRIDYIVDDAAALNKLQGEFETLVCSLALMNIQKADKAMRKMSARLVEGGKAIFVVLHPAFRIPKFSHWYWEPELKMQFRRVDRYLSETSIFIQTHPGAAPDRTTTTYHRPISYYLNALIEADFALESVEEWCSDKVSEPGPRAEAENTARNEFPVFLTLVARKRTPPLD